jgi:hypothetical protein
MEVDGKSVATVEAAVAALNEARGGDGNARLLVRRGDTQRYVGLKFS